MTLNLAVLLRDSSRHHPHETAVVADGERIDYATLDERSRRFAGVLGGLGILRGEHVALLLPNTPAFSICYFGCHYAANPVVPLNFLLKEEEIAYHLRDSDAAALVVWEDYLEAAMPAVAATSSCRHVIVARPDSAPTAGAPDRIELAAALAGATAVEELPDTAADNTAVILYTSGTTGHPKGAELSHFNLFYNAELSRTLMPITTESKALLTLPLFHSFGQTVLQNAFVGAGGTIVLMRRFDAGDAFRLMESERVTNFAGVPTMYFELLHHEHADAYDTSSLRYCCSGGAPMPVEVMAAFDQRFGVNILEGYGLSETSPVASFNVLDRPKKAGSIGMPVRGVEFRLIDDKGVVVTDSGVPGEIEIKGHNVMKGYYKRPDATAEALRNGWLRTGDIATRDDDGFYFIVDRQKDMILRGGFNVYPREIEEILFGLNGVRECAVIGVPDERLGEEVKAFVVLAPNADLSERDVVDYCKERLADYKYPRFVEFREELPRGSTGKVLKRALRA